MSGPTERRARSRPVPATGEGDRPPVAVAAVVVLAVVAVAAVALGTDGPSGLIESRVLRLAETLLAVVVVVGVYRRRALAATPRERLAWIVVGTLGAGTCATMATFVVDPSLGGRLYGPFPTNVLQMAVAPLAVGALLLLGRPIQNRVQALRLTMDGAAIACSTVVLGWYVAVRPLSDSGLGSDLTTTSAMAYIVFDAVAFALGLLVLSRASAPLRRTVALAVVGLALLLFADVVRIVHYLPGPQDVPGPQGTSTLSELGLIGALAFLAVAVSLPRRPLRNDREVVAGAGRGG